MKIICIGRNYTEHIEELGNEKPDEPVIFMKPDSALLRNNDAFYLPDFSNDIHHEVEVVVRINRVGKSIEQKFAGKYYDEIGLGIDFTARDLQSKLKSKGLPWERAKGFNMSAPISPFISKEGIDLTNLDFHLDINGETVQKGNTSFMLFPIDEIIAYVSQYFTLKKGDLIYTGTPKGVGPVKLGDRLKGYLKGELMFDFEVK
ncbi:MAG: fumarylacetoacetate hydrolase family protein [Cytophagales bacterium]|nr:fumarylacetoacetate hydrolase family protein [Cytophagales bacterium]